MNISKELDLAIKLSEEKTLDGEYIIKESKYGTYMTKEKWENFKSAMIPSALQEYGEGGGSELCEKGGYPPKMACYGSSSRMIYNLSQHKSGFHFEKKFPTTIGGTANLDGFYEDENRYVFVEAKCHEPYSIKNNSVSKSYEKLYNFINIQMADKIKIHMTTSKCGRYMNVEYFVENEKLQYFDMKQMICHLLGIATGVIKGTLDKKKIDFICLIYDPTSLNLAADIKATITYVMSAILWTLKLFFALFLNFCKRKNSEKLFLRRSSIHSFVSLRFRLHLRKFIKRY